MHMTIVLKAALTVFKVKYAVIAEPTVLQKMFMCSICLTLRHYNS
jgi:hypothetical protein